MRTAFSCPDARQLQSLWLGQLSEPEADQLEQHLLGCQACLQTLRSLPAQDTLEDALRAQGTATGDGNEAPVQSLIERLRSLRTGHATTPPEAGSQSYDFLAPPQAADELGRLGHYRVLKVLGTGGMGVVFEAEDTQLRRRVALKAMKPALAASDSARKRFLREAQAAAALTHDHVVTIYHVGEDRGVPFLAMQFLAGESLEDRLQRAGGVNLLMPVAEALRIGREIAEGLAAAHQRGLIHRDVKPGNVWLEVERGRVKLLDFGLARAAEPDVALTQTGAIVGTPAYMAPEQAKCEHVDARADLFSLGCVLYRACTGELPFRGASTTALLLSLAMDHPTPPRQLNPAVPPALNHLILLLLAKDRADRPSSARAVVKAIEAVEREMTTPIEESVARSESAKGVAEAPEAAPRPSKTPGVPPNRRRVLVAALAAAVLFAAVTVIRVATDKGELVIKADESVEVTIKRNGKPVEDLELKKGDNVTSVYSGEIEVVLKGANADEFVVKNNRITLKRGDKPVVEIERKVAGERAAGSNPVAQPDADRKSAEWVLSIDGKVSIDVGGVRKDIAAADDLPAGTWKLVSIDLADNKHFTNAGLVHLKGLTNLKELSLDGSDVSDAGLLHLKTLTNLTFLRLASTPVSDAGLEHLKGLIKLKTLDLGFTKLSGAHLDWGSTQVSDAGLKHLETLTNLTTLDLGGTQVSDAGLKHLQPLTNLTSLNLYPTKVTAAGVDGLRKALPKCEFPNFPSSSPDRRAAEWVLSIGGTIKIRENGQERGIEAVGDLPQGAFELTLVDLHNNPKGTDAGLAQCKDCKNLTYLRLSYTRVTDAGLAHFKECKKLTVLDLNGAQVTDVGLAHFNHCKGLMVLALAYAPVTDTGLAHFKDCKNLTDLVIHATEVSDAGLAHFKDCKNLTRLWLPKQVTDAGLAHFKDCKNLTSLNLWGLRVTDAGLAHFKDCKNLTVLDLHDTPTTDAGLAHFKDCKNLTGLYLAGTALTDAGLAHFKDCKNLTILDLSSTKVSDAGLAHFKDCKNLTTIYLQDTQVSDAGLAHLNSSLAILKDLHLEKTKVTAAGFGTLQKAMPNCKITWYENTPDRRAAEWVLSIGGTISIQENGQERQPAAVSDLARGAFKLTYAILNSNQKVTDAGLAHFKDCKNLTHLNLYGTRVTDAGLAHFKDCKNLVFLGLGSQVTEAGLAYFKDCKNLKKLALCDMHVTEAGLAHFKDCKNLTELDFRGSDVTDAGLAHFKDCKNLTGLSLYQSKVTDAGLAHFRDCKNLTGLDLRGAAATDTGLAYFKDCKNLTSLDLTGKRVSDAGLAHFKDCKNLVYLSLASTQVTDVGLATLKDCQNLTSFNLNGTQVTDAGLGHIKDCKNLSHLDLGGTRIGDTGLAHVKAFHNLTFLTLSSTKVTDAGLAQLGDSRKLTTLALGDTRVSDAALELLANHSNLTHLNLQAARISRRGYEQLKAALPNCEIVWLEPNRYTAEQVLALGGTVEIATLGKDDVHAVKTADALPREFFQVRRISVKGVTKRLDEPLGALWSLKFAEFDRLEAIDLSGTNLSTMEFLTVIHGLKELNLSGASINGFEFLSRIPALQDLTLAKEELTDDHLAKFPKLPKLKRLVLDDNPILGRSLGQLHNQPELVDLSLNCPSIADLLAKNLAELKRLKRLSLVGANLSDAGIRHLEGLTNLTALDLRKTKATAAGVAALQQALPKCKIEWDGVGKK